MRIAVARSLTLCLLVLASISPRVVLAWTAVGDGIEYQEFTVSGPNRVFVSRLVRSNMNAAIESSIGQGRLSGGNETIPGQAARYDDAINYWGQIWGQRNDVVVAINGDYWDPTDTDVPYSGQVQSGWYAKRFNNNTGDSGFAWKLDRNVFIDDCVTHVASKQVVTYADATTQTFQGINIPRPADSMIVYTPHYDRDTNTSNTGVEVLVELTPRPMLIVPLPSKVLGYVRQIRQNLGSTPIPFDHVVLSATGTAATTLLSKVQVGDQIGISNETGNCGGGISYDWTKAYASVGGNYIFLLNGNIFDGGSDPGLILRNPRTAIAYNDTYVFFVVVDGRDPGVSEGMTMAEIGNFCKNTLGALYGINNDGGGSSTMVVNGVVKNNPSDGSPRSVPNGIMMINVLPKVQSTVFAAGASVKTNTSNVNVRMGPGTNYAALTSVAKGAQGTVADHSLNGVYAKGYYWWKVDFGGGTVGWVAESLLSPVCTAPAITAHPQAQDVCIGGTAIFGVGASGSEPLSHQWQKDRADLSEGGHYSGVTSATLTVSSADGDDAADYRCVVTNSCGSATSNEAALTVRPPVSVSIGSPSVSMTAAGPASYVVTYGNADTVTLSPVDVTLNKTGSADATISVTGSGNTSRTVTLSSIVGDGTLGVSIAAGTAMGCDAAPAAGPSATFLVDNTPPGAVAVTDQGTWTPSLTTLAASWTASSDGGSGIDRYEYAIGSTPTSQDEKGWTAVGVATSMEDSSLSLAEGSQYFIQARAVDNVGLAGPGSAADGITVAAAVSSIGEAWSLANSVGLSLRNRAVTAVLGSAFWLEEQDRSAAIKIVSPASVGAGDLVSVAGVLGMSGSQRALIGDVIENHGGGDIPESLALIQRSLGGADVNELTPGVTGGTSLYNIGLLVTCFGTVTHSNVDNPSDKYFYFDDGSGLSDGGAYPGVRVRCGTVDPPASGTAKVTGVITSEDTGGMAVPVLIIRTGADIVTL